MRPRLKTSMIGYPKSLCEMEAQPSRVPPAKRSRSAWLRAIALWLSSAYASLWLMLTEAAMHLSCDATRAAAVFSCRMSREVSGTAPFLSH
jgi:hypothetical protein